ncbi:MAG: hypothetical protein JW774_09935 [Candidatus Aureabacteria bacterium]|nr:hypothetical protein [Candidatus Auribacterota bacterium]
MIIKILLFLFIIFSTYSRVFAQNIITVYCGKTLATVNPNIFGNNLLGYDPSTYEDWTEEFYGYSDYGAGIWDPVSARPNADVIDLMKKAGFRVLRFPGGCGSHTYDWKETVGKNRKNFLFGLDEFLQVCKEIGAEPVITLSYFTGTEQDAADMVEYLNSPDDGNHIWAAKRAQNGHREPYHVKYFEVGNEVYHGNHRSIPEIKPEEYAGRYLKYYSVLKKTDPSVRVGIVLLDPEWNNPVAALIINKVDFGIIHTYPTPAWGKKLETFSAEEIFEVSLAVPLIRDHYVFKEVSALLRRSSGKTVPLAITEFNGGYVQEKPVPYRFSLGCALVNAELIRVFMMPENHILMANYWQLCNSYWGMIANGFRDNPADLYNPYYKRPNYYVFEMYHEHWGDELLDAHVSSSSYDISEYEWFRYYLHNNKPGNVIGENLLFKRWKIHKVFRVKARVEKGTEGKAGKEGNILKIVFKKPWKRNYYHCYMTAKVAPNTFYRLSGYIKTENYISDHGICLEIQDSRGWDAVHSAASTRALSGDNDWTYVETLYLTLPDAGAVKVFARNIGKVKKIQGVACFKDVKLEKFIPVTDGKIPYLSVNASRSKDGKKVYLMVINKNLNEPMQTTIQLKDFNPAATADVWTLNGPDVISTNEQNHDNVKVIHKTVQIPGANFSYTFEPHSLTALEIRGKGK